MDQTFKGWLITLLGALFFFYSFLEVNMLSALNGALALTFKADASKIGLLSAWCFYSNVLFLIPAGLMLDRFSIRKLMLANMLIIIFATFLFAFSPNIVIASIARFISGIMMAFGLIICLKLASLVLPVAHMALASSIIVTIGMFGGIFAHLPMERLILIFGWRAAVAIIAFLGLFIFTLFWLFIPKEDKKQKIVSISILASLKEVISLPANWLSGFFIALLNFPVAILGALFGISYLSHVYLLTTKMSASITSFLFLGMIVGSPFFGWFSDFIKRRKIPMMIGSILCLIFTCLLIYISWPKIIMLYLLFFFVGFTSAAQVVGYPYIQEKNPSHLTGAALSLATILIMGLGYGLGLPFVGNLLDSVGAHKKIAGVTVYQASAYVKAFTTLPIAIVISFIATIFMKESFAKEVK